MKKKVQESIFKIRLICDYLRTSKTAKSIFIISYCISSTSYVSNVSGTNIPSETTVPKPARDIKVEAAADTGETCSARGWLVGWKQARKGGSKGQG